MNNKQTTLNRGYMIALLAAAILSTTAIFIRYLTETYHIPALVLAFWRDVFVVATLIPVLALFKPALLHIERRHMVYLVLYGLLLSVFNALWTLSVAMNGAAVATVLVYSSGAFTALLGRWLLRERLDGFKLLAVALSLGGCVLVAGVVDPQAFGANVIGLAVGVFAGLSYAVYSLMGRSASQRGLNPWTTLLYTFAFAAVFLLLVNLLPGSWLPGKAAHPVDFFALGSALTGWVVLFLLGAGPTVLGFGSYNVSLSYLPSSVANLIVTLEPAFTAVIAYYLLGERLNGMELLGGLLILMGVVCLRVSEQASLNSAAAMTPSSQQI